MKTADQLKIKGLCEVPESKEGPPSVSLSSPPRDRDSGTPRLNYTKLRRQHHPRYKRPRFEARSDSRIFEKYKEEDNEGLCRDDKEVSRSFRPITDFKMFFHLKNKKK